ncbi:hypothetical protein RSOLAG1IB_02633 [Rhizoctonia solani AG-1 IB]|uniref:GATA-type domain-containing protein n=2 Tax=Rhizoctonia solani TaxID=456999 RepID=M5BLE3_THACB|nr:unnamed protein product [Rhizoctonia solani]CCO27020.1 hypothetical protein BN14_01053 [Rhizoctonia solani AG-1 IB]CEL57889.1 hypothetical protein RSOLAG1IB_02633 [Rhizoctonia solani AG-1 IB]
MDDELRPLPDHDDGPDMRQRAHSVMPPRRSTNYDSRTDPRAQPQPRRQSTSAVGLPASAPGWHSPPPPQSYYSQQDAFGAHAYIEPRAQPMPPPPPHPSWGYQLPPPQGYPPSRAPPPRSPPPTQYDPRYRQPSYPYPHPSSGYGQPPYAPGPGGPTVDPTIFKADPYGRPMPTSPPDSTRPDVQITYTDDSATKLTQYLRRRCFNCRVTEPPGWRKSTLNPGKIVCNKCGLYERSHARPRPLHMDNPKGPTQ